MESPAPPFRKIIHIDMDAFYASVEQRDNPELRGKPVAVGGGGPRGVVAAASYESREFGVRSAMPGGKARRLCPELVFVRPRFDVYREVSQQIRQIFHRFTDIIQPLSLDEAYLDVTRNKPGIASATYVAQEIRRMIHEEIGLTASAGVSYCKLIAKLASDQNKPDGICVVTPEQGADFIAAMPVSRIHGIGPVTARRMREMGIETGADLRRIDLELLQARFGKAARFYYGAARGVDERLVEECQVRKSISVEDTFEDDLYGPKELDEALIPIVDRLWSRIEKAQAWGRTITLKVKFNDFSIITRSLSMPKPITDPDLLRTSGRNLLAKQCPVPKGVRLLGLGIHNMGESGEAASSPAKPPVPPFPRAEQLALAL
jgi:DNA polymerase-4